MINATFSSFLHSLFFGLWHLPSLTHICLSVFTNFLHICRGTKWICSSKYLFFRQICAGKTFRKNSIPLEGNCCCWDIDNSGCLRGLHGCLEWMSWVRNSYIFPCSLPKCLKWFKKSLFMLCCFFLALFFKISCWVPRYLPGEHLCKSIFSSIELLATWLRELEVRNKLVTY